MLKWVRLGGKLDLLDAPGVIPASFSDQIAAQRLAMCNDIGEAAYVESLVASALIVRCKTLQRNAKLLERLQERYKIDPLSCTAEDFVQGVADRLFFGDRENAGVRILKDFRNGALGSFALELPPEAEATSASAGSGAFNDDPITALMSSDQKRVWGVRDASWHEGDSGRKTASWREED
jgi:ribosome biogenesis GTPase A